MRITGNLTGSVVMFFSPPHFKLLVKSWGPLSPREVAACWEAEAAYSQEHVLPHIKGWIRGGANVKCPRENGREECLWRTWKGKDQAFLSQPAEGGCSDPYPLPGGTRNGNKGSERSCWILFLETPGTEVLRSGKIFPSPGCYRSSYMASRNNGGVVHADPGGVGWLCPSPAFQAPQKPLRFF